MDAIAGNGGAFKKKKIHIEWLKQIKLLHTKQNGKTFFENKNFSIYSNMFYINFYYTHHILKK